jgi:N,N-dimethylformamidase beta subunit-like, C-terminal/Domain of unknown function (DUF4082)/Bacterial Ig-like domain/Calx-beta domain/Bacterial Ig domain/Purple acid Phosphatase, N-terminal domain
MCTTPVRPELLGDGLARVSSRVVQHNPPGSNRMSHRIASPSFSVIRWCSMALVVALGATLAESLSDDFIANAQAGCANAIACENQLPGAPASEWDVSGAGDPAIQGFATDISVARGDTVRFKVDTTALAFRLDIYRMGYYGGLGARRIPTVPTVIPTIATDQPACLTNGATGLIDCGIWLESASWQVPIDAVSGIYFAKITRLVGGNPTGGGSHIVFIVRDDTGNSDVLFQTSDTTWQAYNAYGGNSLYTGGPGTNPGRAYKVSYNRPFITRAGGENHDWLFHAEYPMVRWLEANGFDVSYASGVDTDRRGPGALQQHKVFMSVGHDEYWSGAQRANVEAARAAGVHLAFFSGNEMFWKTRWENSIDGSNTPYRTLVCYKETHADAKIDPNPAWTGTWRDPRFSPPADGGRPENAVSGTIFMVNEGATTAIQVPAAFGPLRFWRNTSIASLPPGQTATLSANTLGYEWDSDLDNGFRPAGLIRLSSRTVTGAPVLQDFGSSYGIGTATHNLTLYRHTGGALVFGAGTVQWSWGLDGTHDGGGSTPDVRMQQATVNLLADMGVQPQTLQSGLTPATASTDTLPPTSTITSPANGSTVTPGSPVTITGTAGDVGGGIVAAVDVSVDGGLTWRRATGTTSWSLSWTPAGSGTATIRSRAFDDSGFIETPSSGVTVTIGSGGGGTCPCSIWSPSTVPANPAESDAAAVELGVKFRSNVAGFITGIRYYKSSQNTGTHLGHLWTSTGTLLATATFAGESTSGWQQVNFSSPVAINPNTTYVASYHTTTGFYAQDSNYFASSVTNGPLTALANGVDGGNGVYRYGTSGFPTSTFQGSNYWVDVVFVTSAGSDTTPPTVSSVSPANGASGVATSASVSVVFSEGMDPSTINTSTIELRNPTNGLIPASVTWSAASFTATVTPTSALLNSTTYTLTAKGGATDPRVTDIAGNALASNFTSTFTTAAPPPPPPNDGPGGPILVVSSSANPFSRYYVEILRAEGLNAFLATDIANVSSTVLANYDVVILGEMPLSTAQVTMFSDWVNAGGNLIAMRPDKKLATLLGLTDAGTTLPEAYLLVNTGAAPGAGIVNQTMQFHGTADRYTMSGATAVATLYSNRTTATSNPAVTVRSVGTAGGEAAAFTYDLARSVVYTRQGNPAWSGQERDGQSPIRSDDLFFGGAQPDWVDLTKVAIPQADEQQRLLANLILFMNTDRKPLPRFWYLPRGLKAAVVMTGDDHANNGTAGRFNIYTADSPPGCSVNDWECVRATSYIYPNTPINPSQAAAFVANGFEIAVHVTTLCQDYTPQSLEANFDNDLADFAANFPGLPAPKTNRTHCIAWSDYSSHPQTELAHGIRFDTNYYYWPPSWVNDTPGLFTGSAMPMRFARADGTLLDVYQATTQMTDESGQSYPLHIDTLLDRALGPQGYYGVFTTNMHTDDAVHAGSEAIVTSAQSRGVPIVSSKQMLDWIDGRNGSAFGNLSWSGTTLSFTVAVGSGANGLRGLVPVASRSGPIAGITLNGNPVSFTTQTIKGVGYAMFAATAGNYQVQYAVDTTAPVISALTAVAGETSATVSWTTDEPATSLVNYGLTPTSLSSSSSVAGLRTGHEVLLTGLTPGTQYYYRVTSADAAGNSTSAPASPATFTTNSPPPPGAVTVSDTAAADFAGGTGTGTYVSESGNGELILAPSVGAEFSGAALPTGWTSELWNAGGAAMVAGGMLSVDGARANTDALFGPGRALDFVATFGTAASQHVGFGVTLNETPWAIFSTGTGGSLLARTHTGTTPTDTVIPGNWLNAPHDFRIEWNTSSVVFLIDGGVVATHAVTIDTNMRPIASDFTVGGNVPTVNWMRMSPYATSATFDSRVLDGGAMASWGSADWTSVTPANTSVALSARFGNTAVPDGTWTAFFPLSAPGTNNLSQTSRYLQYRAVLTSATAGQTPSLNDITFTAAGGAIPPAISISDLSINEGDVGQTNAVVTLTLSATSPSTVTVQYVTADGTAAATTDYTAGSGTATFTPGTTSTTVTIPVNGDTTVEPNETFFVNLTSPVNGTITDAQGVVTIVNDDSTLSELTLGNGTVTEGNTGSISATFTVTLTPAKTTGPVTVSYQTADGTATAGSDYVATSGTLTIPAGTTTQTITVPVLGDTLDEANETFLVRLSAPVGAALGTPSQGTGTITDNDATPAFRISDVSLNEGSGGGTVLATFTVTLSAVSGRATSVNYATSNGTATVGSGDYVAASGTLSFPAGTTSQQVSVTVNSDLLNENNETFNLNLSGATSATIADNRGIATIVNDDLPPAVSIADVSVMEGNTGTKNVTFTVALSAASGKTITVNYATANGDALAGSDYVAKTGTVTFNPGQTTRTFTVAIVNDRVAEATETFVVNLPTATNASIADNQAVCTITDNDAALEAP